MRLESRYFGVVGVADRPAQPVVELVAVEDHLPGVHRLDGSKAHPEVSGVLDVDHDTVREHLPDRAELRVAVGDERLVADLDRLSHDSTSLGAHTPV